MERSQGIPEGEEDKRRKAKGGQPNTFLTNTSLSLFVENSQDDEFEIPWID